MTADVSESAASIFWTDKLKTEAAADSCKYSKQQVP
jgi:hypothetical protein